MGCGIAGFVGPPDSGLLRLMCDAIRHRGPDSTGSYIDSNVSLGVDRLKIIDLELGDQPIHNEDESIWLVYNGEVYNYIELKQELESNGHRFYTTCDTETIVHGYEEWGERCVEHLRGMFAFALWDTKRKRLFLARDRFGKKPLFYAQQDGRLFFASEPKAILQYADLNLEIDYEAVDYYFTYMYIPSPMTIFRGIRKLPAGSTAIYEGEQLQISQYWDFGPAPESSLDEDSVVELLYQSITTAVKLRLRSDVPLGAFLSGGIDSSVVTSVMSRLSDRPVKTVSIGFAGVQDELRYSREVAELLHTDHKEYVATPEAYKLLPKLVWQFDEPFADHSMIPTYYLCQVARKEVTVALSGDGGDELFMGYPFLLDPRSYSLYRRVPAAVRRPAVGLIAKLPFDVQAKRMANHAYEKDYGAQTIERRLAMRVSIYDQAGLRRLYSADHLSAHPPGDTYRYLSDLVTRRGMDALDSVDYATIRSYLEEDILTKVDRMSMAVSLEARCPLLDQELTKLVERIPARMKMRGRTTKYIFKKMAVRKGLIPSKIANRPKQGFGAPIQVWMKGEWKDILSEMLDPEAMRRRVKLFEPSHVQQLVSSPYTHSNRLFALVTFLIWHRLYLEEGIKKSPPESLVVA